MRSYIRSHPISLVLIAGMWLLWIGSRVASHSPSPRLSLHTLGYSVADPWPHVLTSGLTTATLSGLLLSTAALAIFGALSERRLGSVHYLFAALLSQILGMAGGTGIALFAESIGLSAGEFERERILAPLWIVGVVAYSSGVFPPLWRSRIRLATSVYAVTRILYAGTLRDAVVFSCTILGVLASCALQRYMAPRMAAPTQPLRSPRERRVVLGIIAFAVFLGPLFAAAGPNSAALFGPSSLFVWHGGAAQVHELCTINRFSRACINAIYLSGHIGLGGFLANQLPIGLMLVSAWGLTKGRRLAYWLTIAGSILTIVAVALELMSISDADIPSVAIVTVLAALPWIVLIISLLAMRKDFMVHTNRDARRLFALRVLGTAGVCSALWVAGAWIARSQFEPALSFTHILSDTGMRFVPPSLALSLNISAFPITLAAGMLVIWPGIIFWLVALISLILVLRSSPHRESEVAHQHARELLTHGTGDHISWMTLWPHNHYWFDPEGGGYVAFRLYSLVAVTLGGPVLTSSNRDAQAVAQRFEQYAAHSGWSVAWYSVCEEFAQQRETAGWHKVQVAEESVLDASTEPAFTGKKFQDIRTARNHAAKENIRIVEGTWAELSPAIQADIVALSEQWVSDKALPEMGFTLGGVKTLSDPAVHLVLAIDDADHVHGATSWLPVYEDGTVRGWILDFMRRDTAGFRLVVDFLIAESWVSAHRHGVQWLSLSGAPLSHSEQAEAPSPLLKMLDTIGGAMEPLYGFRSLASFKKKFQPHHHAWYLCYHDELGLPAIGLAVSHAYTPDLTFAQLVRAIRQLPSATTLRHGKQLHAKQADAQQASAKQASAHTASQAQHTASQAQENQAAAKSNRS
ncbi:MAG: phosphatidylglycerol lysyltransferase domain-containing protein [Arcanobacterium sp.]|nr:phosphatidylglycerol lysyltransferase domain-containing protein [Arcanobacterium sp.]